MRRAILGLLIALPVGSLGQQAGGPREFSGCPLGIDRCYESYYPPGHTMQIRLRRIVTEAAGSMQEEMTHHAVKSDGSRVEHQRTHSLIHDVPRNLTTLIDHTRKVYRQYEGSDGRPSWAYDDEQCSCAASRYWYAGWQATGEMYRRGNRLVQWTGISADGSFVEAYFAPEQHCVELSRETSSEMSVETYVKEVVSLSWGEPSEELFHVREGYVRETVYKGRVEARQ